MNLQTPDAHLSDLRHAREQRITELGAVRAREEFAASKPRTEAMIREARKQIDALRLPTETAAFLATL